MFAYKSDSAVFYFYIFYFHFLQKKIYFQFGNLQQYNPASPLPGGRDLTTQQRGGRGISEKKNSHKKLRTGPWEPAAWQRDGRPWPPGCGATGRNFCNLTLFAKEFHICVFFITFCRNRLCRPAPR
jgi:hypothetical protein